MGEFLHFVLFRPNLKRPKVETGEFLQIVKIHPNLNWMNFYNL